MHFLTDVSTSNNTSSFSIMKSTNVNSSKENHFFSKLSNEMINIILVESLNCDISELAKWRLVNHQWKQFIDKHVFKSYLDFMTTCLTAHKPISTTSVLEGEFIEDDTFSHEDSTYSHDNQVAKKIKVSITQSFFSGTENDCEEDNKIDMSCLRTVDMSLNSDQGSNINIKNQPHKKIALMTLQAIKYLRSGGIVLRLTGLADEVIKTNQLRINDGIKYVSDNPHVRWGKIWYHHDTGRVEGFQANRCKLQLFDNVKEKDLARRESDEEICFSIDDEFQKPTGPYKYSIGRISNKINTEDWSLKARITIEMFWSIQLMLLNRA